MDTISPGRPSTPVSRHRTVRRSPASPQAELHAPSGEAAFDSAAGPPPGVGLAVLELAAAIEAQEARVKELLLEAAEAGDRELVCRLLRLWINGPVSEVMAQLDTPACVQH